jgi:hypothetical protein
MANINKAPLTKPLMENDRLTNAWEFFFSGIGDGLDGKWELTKRNLIKTNLDDNAPSKELVSYQGREVTFSFVWDAGATFSNSSMALEIRNGRGDFTMEEGYLQVWDGSTQVEGAYCSDLTINLPDLVTGNKIIIQGTLLTKKQYRN